MKLTIVESPKQPQIPTKLFYSDVIRITGIQSGHYTDDAYYFIIAQVDHGKMALFIMNPVYTTDYFNRSFDPVEVEWLDLNTESVKELLPWKCEKVEKVNAELTLIIKD